MNNEDNVFNAQNVEAALPRKQKEARPVSLADWQTGAFLRNHPLKTSLIQKLYSQSLIWAEHEGPYSCVSALVPGTGQRGAGAEARRVVETGSAGRRAQSPVAASPAHAEGRETVPSFQHSGKEG